MRMSGLLPTSSALSPWVSYWAWVLHYLPQLVDQQALRCGLLLVPSELKLSMLSPAHLWQGCWEPQLRSSHMFNKIFNCWAIFSVEYFWIALWWWFDTLTQFLCPSILTFSSIIFLLPNSASSAALNWHHRINGNWCCSRRSSPV